jgi:small subunit ribosomal protein S2
MRQLLEAGVHFGHQTRRWNPKMRPYIYGERNGIYIIDLEQTTRALDKACEYVRKAASEKKNIIFVGTKKQASEIVEEEAKRCGAFYVTAVGWVACSQTLRPSACVSTASKNSKR